MQTALEIAKHAGFDLSLIEENLRLTPEQRLLQHQLALDALQQLYNAHQSAFKLQNNDQAQQPSANPL
jgi:hypothetical protein